MHSYIRLAIVMTMPDFQSTKLNSLSPTNTQSGKEKHEGAKGLKKKL